MPAAGILGVGSYVPETVVTNADLEKIVETSDEWIASRSGIRERRVVGDGVNTSDLAAEAAKLALADAGLAADDVDAVIVATSSPEMIFPSTACLTMAKLGLKNRMALDVSAACAGFVFGLNVAANFIECGGYRNILFIGADALTRHVDWTDRKTCVLFGDGAGAVVLGPVEEGTGVLASYLSADGEGADLLKIPAGGSAMPGDENTVAEGLHFIKMNGNEVYKFAIRALPEATEKALAAAGLTVEDITYLVPHQANQRIIEAAAARLGIDESRVVSNIAKYGNTSCASIPLALDELRRKVELKKGDCLVFVGFGAGLTWGANVLRWSM